MRSHLALALVTTIGCIDDGTPVAPVERASLTLALHAPGADEACVVIALPDDPDGAPRTHCGLVPPNGPLVARADAACVRDTSVRATVSLAKLATDGVTEGWPDPCGRSGCTVELPCGGPATEVLLRLANDHTGADFIATTVALPGVLLGGTVRTCSDGAPLSLLKDGDEARATALVTFAATSLHASTVAITAAVPTITCEGGVRCALDLTVAGSDPERTSVPMVSQCSDGTTVDYVVHAGFGPPLPPPPITRSAYLSLAIDLQDLVDRGQRACRLTHALTASRSPLALGPAEAYPVARFDAPLVDTDGTVACTEATFDDYGVEDPDVLRIAYVLGDRLTAPDRPTVPPLCFSAVGPTIMGSCER